MNTIFAAITDWSLAGQVVDRALLLARAYGARLRVYRPVDDQLEELNRYVGFDNYRELREELIEDNRVRMNEMLADLDVDYEVEWQPKAYRGIAEKAEEASADLIVIAMDQHSVLGDLLHKPDDWHLLRDAACPVMLISRNDHPVRRVVAAVDCLDDNDEAQALTGRLLDQARGLADAMKLPLTVISVVPDPAYIYADISAAALITDFRSQAEQAAMEKQRAIIARLGVPVDEEKVVSGPVDAMLEKAMAESGILVLGTIANKGVKGFFVGNTAERILRHVSGDMFVVN
jgi:universal stress protein E